MSFKSLKLWESKLNFVKQKRDDIRSFDISWHDHEQRDRYNQMVIDIERKVNEYEELIEYLRGDN